MPPARNAYPKAFLFLSFCKHSSKQHTSVYLKFSNVSNSSLHQLHVIDPKWVEDVQNRAFRDRLADAVVAADKLIAGRVNSNVYQEYKTLVELHKDPWTGSAILPIISGTPDYKSIGK